MLLQNAAICFASHFPCKYFYLKKSLLARVLELFCVVSFLDDSTEAVRLLALDFYEKKSGACDLYM